MFTQRMKPHKKTVSETDFSRDSDYDELVNKILLVGDILQPFQYELVFTAAEIQAKEILIGWPTSA